MTPQLLSEAPAFVARERELASLQARLDAALRGSGQVCFVTGEPGSGKTALVSEFTRRAQQGNPELLVVVGGCNAQTGTGDPYLPFREIMRLLTGDVEVSLAERRITADNAGRLRSFLRMSGEALVESGPDLVGIFVPGGSLLARMGSKLAQQAGWAERLPALARPESPPAHGGADQGQIFEQFTNVLRRLAAQQPLVLVLDDLQWADAASIGLLFHLARRVEGSRILVLGTYRPNDVALGRGGERHPLEPVLNELTRYHGDIRVDLGEVDEPERRRLVDALVDVEPNRLGPAFREALYRHTEGHALFTVELLRSLRESGVLVRDAAGRWTEGEQVEWHTLPSRVEGVIEERIGRLEADLRETLAVASVEGEDFTAEVVARVRATEERGIVRRLSGELERQHQLVTAQGASRLGQQRLSLYRFRHSLFQKYLYGRLDEVERSYLHEDVGRALEALYGERAGEVAVQLARHFVEAGETERAIGYLAQAGERAREHYANEEALQHFRKALELLEGLPGSAARRDELIRLREGMADVLALTGKRDEALRAYEAAAGLLAPEDRVHRARLRRKVGDALQAQHRLQEALSAYGEAEALLEESSSAAGTEQERVQIYLALVWTHYWAGHTQELEALLQRVRPVVEHHGTREQRAQLLSGLILLKLRRERYAISDTTLEYAISCRDMRVEAGNPRLLAEAWFQIGFCHLWRGDLDDSETSLREGLAQAERIGHAWSRLLCLTYLTILYRFRGSVDVVREYAGRSLAAALEAQLPVYTGMARANLGWAALREGDVAAAEAAAAEAMAEWQRSPMRYGFQWAARWPLLWILLDRGEVEQAVEQAREVLLPDQQKLPDAVEEALAHATALWDQGRAEEAAGALRGAAEIARRVGYL